MRIFIKVTQFISAVLIFGVALCILWLELMFLP